MSGRASILIRQETGAGKSEGIRGDAGRTCFRSPGRGVFLLPLCIGLVALVWSLAYPVGFPNWDVVGGSIRILKIDKVQPEEVWVAGHPIEVLIVRVVRHLAGIESPLRAYQVITSVLGALTVALLSWTLARVTGSLAISAGAGSLLIASHGFWRIASGGEEKTHAMLALTAIFALVLMICGELGGESERPREAPVWAAALAAAVGLGIVLHMVVGAAAVAAFLLGMLPSRLPPKTARRLWQGAVAGTALAGLTYVAIATGPVGRRDATGVFRWVFRHHVEINYWMDGQVRRTPGEYVTRLASGIVSCFTLNPAIWTEALPGPESGSAEAAASPQAEGTGVVVVGICLLLIAAALFLAVHSRRVIPSGARFVAFASLPWLANFLFFEPQNLESWMPFVPLVMIVSGAGLAVRFGRTPSSARLLWAGAGLATSALVLLNAPVWAVLHEPPCVVRSSRELSPRIPPGSVLLCGYVGGWVRSNEGSFFIHDTALILDVTVLQVPDPGREAEFLASREVLDTLSQAWGRGSPVLVTSNLLSAASDLLPGNIAPTPFAATDCMALHRLEP